VSIWITCCSGRRQISKTSCSISGPTSTTIARIPHGKGERRIRRCHDQSQISARLDGSPIVDPYFRPQWLPNFANIRAHCGIRSGLQKPRMKSCGVCALGCSAFRGSDRFTVTRSVQKRRSISLSRRDLPVILALAAIRQKQAQLCASCTMSHEIGTRKIFLLTFTRVYEYLSVRSTESVIWSRAIPFSKS
jgi:hypothetical protein